MLKKKNLSIMWGDTIIKKIFLKLMELILENKKMHFLNLLRNINTEKDKQINKISNF